MTSPTEPIWVRLYNDVKIDLPGVTDAVFKQELFRVLKDFFDKTNIWIEEVPITGMPNVTLYPFTVAGKGTPSRLMMLFNPALSPPALPRWIQTYVAMPEPGVIQVGYAPSEQVQWVAAVTKNIVDPVDAESYPEIDDGTGPVADKTWIIDKYRDCLSFGVLYRLQMQPTKPYSNPVLGKYNYGHYMSERGKARADAMKQNAYGAQNWQFPQAWATTARKGWV
jgi:hypothetical protein